MAGMVVTVGDRTSSTVLRAYDADDGSSLWTADHAAAVNCVAIDVNGNVYTGGGPASSITTRKYSQNGTLVWSKNHLAIVYGIAVDSNGYVYTVGASYGNVTIRKYDNDGNEITTNWPISYTGGRTLYAICIDDDDNIYVTGDVYSDSGTNKTTHKYNSSGTEQWYINRGATTYAINITGDYVTVGGAINSSSYTSGSYNLSDGSLVTGSEKNHGATVRGIARNSNADLCGNLSSGVTTRIASATINHGGTVWCICAHYDGSVFTGGAVASSVTTRKYTSAGVEITTGNWPLNHTDDVRGIASWSPPSVPGLPVEISLGLPIFGGLFNSLALSIETALGIPTTTLNPPPDISILYGPSIYRLFISGTSLLEYPLESFQCQRRLGESTWLTVIIPTYTTGMAAELAARLSAESYLLIYSGVRNDDGSETLGEYLKAILTNIETTFEFNKANFRLTGRVVNPPFSATTRALRGISTSGKDGEKYKVTCEVDPLLKPNDTADDGVQTWTVGIIDVSVGPNESTMIVREA